MEVSVVGLRWTVGVGGALVLASYVLGIARAEDPEALWGGVTGRLRAAMLPFMAMAAVGFLVAAWLLLFRWAPDQVAALHWPWRDADGQGVSRVLVAYVLYLLPSALWLESTLLHLAHGSPWTQALVMAVLTFVSVGLLLLGLLATSALQDGAPHADWLLIAVVAMAVQSTINDNIVWVWKFPW